jgi:hypothetical protein
MAIRLVHSRIASDPDFVFESEKGQPNGVASLDGTGKVPSAQLPSGVAGGMTLKGGWNANTNTPNIGASSPANGDQYAVTVAGATNLSGITDWKVGDCAVYSSDLAQWLKIDNSEAPASGTANDSGVAGATVKDALDTINANAWVTNAKLANDLAFPGTVGNVMPTGTTAQRSGTTDGKVRQNSTTGRPEVYWSGAWRPIGAIIPFTVAVGDETTAITTGTAKVTFRAPFACKHVAIPRANVNTVSSSGLPTVDVKIAGVSMFSTLLTIDASEKTSKTAATAAVMSTNTWADDDEITIDITVAGTGAKGLKVTFYLVETL